jgi:hypothetical protein
MEKFVSHYTALKNWNIPYLDKVLSHEIMTSDIIEYTVTSIKERRRRKGEKYHLCTTKLPNGAVKNVDGERRASPELAFLQVANDLDIQTLILLGMQFCSHPPGHPEAALTTKQKLHDFAMKAEWIRGRRNALRAIRYIADGSHSIMESESYLNMTLPYNLGGFLLKGAVLNQKVPLDKRSAKQLKQENCYVDICYEKSKIAVEYNSLERHNTAQEQSRDVLRAAALERQGYKVIFLTPYQLYNEFMFREFIYDLAKGLGKRIRIRSKKFLKMRAALRRLLPSKNIPVICEETGS